MAYQVVLEPGIGQFRGFEPPPECILVYISWGLFSCAQVGFRKARERELTTLDEKIDEQWDCLESAIKVEGKKPGSRRDHSCDHGFFRRSWKVEVCKKKKK